MKKFAMLMLYLVLVFALAACAGTDTTPQGSVSDTVTVTDMKGEVAIPANPQRIVDVAGLTEELLILDILMMVSVSTLQLRSDIQGVNHEKANMRYDPRVHRNSSGIVWVKTP